MAAQAIGSFLRRAAYRQQFKNGAITISFRLS